MAAAIKKKFNVDAEMIKGGGGIFDVKLNGDLIYSKKQTGRFPTDNEVLQAISAKSVD